MGEWWELALVPRTPGYVPSPVQLDAVLQMFQKRFGLEFSEDLDNESLTDQKAAINHLRKAASSPKGDAEVRFQCDPSTELFGWDPDAGDDDFFWSDTLVVSLRPTPWPHADWECEKASCPSCKASLIDAIAERRNDGSGFASPLECGCGVETPLEKARFSKGVRLSRFCLTFWGNKGWFHDVRNDRDAFKEKTFLPGLEKLLGTAVDVLAISG